ncbi:MAG: LytTR family DNA-binding domain-containing protein [Bacteroidota bacterium]
MKISCIVVDDEPLAADKIADYVSRVPFLECKATLDNGIAAMEYLQNEEVDLIFLDIQMPGLTGIQLLNVLKNKPKVILSTAYSEYALESYELEVSDYLLKPIAFERFLKAVTKVYQSFEHSGKSEPTPIVNTNAETDFIFVKTEYKLQQVKLDSIRYVEGMKDYLRIHTDDGPIMTLMSFTKLQEMLPANAFFRVHKSYLVSVSRITLIEKGEIHIGEQIVPVSETYKEGFFTYLRESKLL